MTEPIRVILNAIRGLLRPLDEQTRFEVLAALELELAADNLGLSKLLDEAREQTEEWRRHNEQRLEEVCAARALLEARPDETLPMAITRMKVERFDVGAATITKKMKSEGWIKP